MTEPDRFIGADPASLEEPLHWLNRAAVARAEAEVCRISSIAVTLRNIADTYCLVADVAAHGDAELMGPMKSAA